MLWYGVFKRTRQADINTHTSHICIAMFSFKHTYNTGLWSRTLLNLNKSPINVSFQRKQT